ncbi:hypothetical protein HDU89_000695 [Geranomyces variabilis]|nr:hypothetical protein HDU89_000695 [Geranomyces variabilis]
MRCVKSDPGQTNHNRSALLLRESTECDNLREELQKCEIIAKELQEKALDAEKAAANVREAARVSLKKLTLAEEKAVESKIKASQALQQADEARAASLDQRKRHIATVQSMIMGAAQHMKQDELVDLFQRMGSQGVTNSTNVAVRARL